jgi:hypothetical protein
MLIQNNKLTDKPIDGIKDTRAHGHLRCDWKYHKLIQRYRFVRVHGAAEQCIYVGDVSLFAHFTVLK